jgi:hypothetical protein
MDARDIARHLVAVSEARAAAGDDCDWFDLPEAQLKVAVDAGVVVKVSIGRGSGKRIVVKLTSRGKSLGAEKASGLGSGGGTDNSYYRLHDGATACGNRYDGWQCLAREGHSGTHEGYFESGKSGHSWANEDAAAAADVAGHWMSVRGAEPCQAKGTAGVCLAFKGHKGDHVSYGSLGIKVLSTWSVEDGGDGGEARYYCEVPGSVMCYEAGLKGDKWPSRCNAAAGHSGDHVRFRADGTVQSSWKCEPASGGNEYYRGAGRMCGHRGPKRAQCNCREGHTGFHREYMTYTRFENEWDDAGRKPPGNEQYKGKGKAARCDGVLMVKGRGEGGSGSGYYVCGAKAGHTGKHHSYGGGDECEWDDETGDMGVLEAFGAAVKAAGEAEKARVAAGGAAPSNAYCRDGNTCGETITGSDKRIAGQRGSGSPAQWTCLAAAGHTGSHRAYDGGGLDAWKNSVEEGEGFPAEWSDGGGSGGCSVSNRKAEEGETACGVRISKSGKAIKGQRGSDPYGELTCKCVMGHEGAHRSYTSGSKDCWGTEVGAGCGWTGEWGGSGGDGDGDGEGKAGHIRGAEATEAQRKAGLCPCTVTSHKCGVSWAGGKEECGSCRGHSGAHRAWDGSVTNAFGEPVLSGLGWSAEWYGDESVTGEGRGGGYEPDYEARCGDACPANGGGTRCWARKGHEGPHRDWSGPGAFSNEWGRWQWAGTGGGDGGPGFEPEHSRRCLAESGGWAMCWARKGHGGAHRNWTSPEGFSHEWTDGDGAARKQLKYFCATRSDACDSRDGGNLCTLESGHPGMHVRTSGRGTVVEASWGGDGDDEDSEILRNYVPAGEGRCKDTCGGKYSRCCLADGHSCDHAVTAGGGARIKERWARERAGAVGNEYLSHTEVGRRCGAEIQPDDQRLDGQRGSAARCGRFSPYTCQAEKGHSGAHRSYTTLRKDPWGAAVGGSGGYGWSVEWCGD